MPMQPPKPTEATSDLTWRIVSCSAKQGTTCNMSRALIGCPHDPALSVGICLEGAEQRGELST